MFHKSTDKQTKKQGVLPNWYSILCKQQKGRNRTWTLLWHDKMQFNELFHSAASQPPSFCTYLPKCNRYCRQQLSLGGWGRKKMKIKIVEPRPSSIFFRLTLIMLSKEEGTLSSHNYNHIFAYKVSDVHRPAMYLK